MHTNPIVITKRGFFVGYRSDGEVAAYLFDVIERQMDAYARTRLDDVGPHKRRTAGRIIRVSYLRGVKGRLERIREDGASQDPTGTALVLRRKQAVDDYMADKHAKLHHRKTRAGNDEAAEQAGATVQLHAGVEGGAPRRIGGGS